METLWRVGHSTRSIEEFIELLRGNGIESVIDVRQYPGSRRYPHFGKERLQASLAAAGIEYYHMPTLGGRRKALEHSPNTAWQNEAFRGYADYMETAEFRAAIEELLGHSHGKKAAIMCSEAVWWRCHRSMISDYLKSTGVEVIHILGPQSTEPHPYTKPAHIVDGRLTYHVPEDPNSLLDK